MIRRSNQSPKLTMRVLNYDSPPPQRPLKQILFDIPTQVVDACGGLNWFLFFLSLCFLSLGFLGIVPVLVLWWIIFDRWSKKSKWF